MIVGRAEQDDVRSRWNLRHATQEAIPEPSEFLVSLDPVLPTAGRALDVAGGTGRNALWLAQHGLEVTLVDISEIALEKAEAEAGRHKVVLHTVLADLERDPFPAGPWDVIACIHYLQHSLFGIFYEEMAPGGWLVCEIATVRNLERNERPPRRFLLEEGELGRLAADFEVVKYAEGWMEDGRHEARLVAQKPMHPGSEPQVPGGS